MNLSGPELKLKLPNHHTHDLNNFLKLVKVILSVTVLMALYRDTEDKVNAVGQMQPIEIT